MILEYDAVKLVISIHINVFICFYVFSLDILTIRRYIVSDLRNKYNSDDEEVKPARKSDIPEQPYPKLSYKGLVSTSHITYPRTTVP